MIDNTVVARYPNPIELGLHLSDVEREQLTLAGPGSWKPDQAKLGLVKFFISIPEPENCINSYENNQDLLFSSK